MKSSIVAIAAVMTTVIGVAGLTDGGFLRPNSNKLPGLPDPSPETTTAIASLTDKASRSPAPQFTEVAQADKPSEERASQRKTPPVVDRSALRYFAAKGDTGRLQAEISRLRSLYPDWVPPSDPLAVPRNNDVALETMWKGYSDGRYAEVRKAIAERQAKDAAWQPPSDLLERLNVAEARARLVNASELKQYETVISVAASTPSLLTCSEVDVLWHVAQAFAETKRPERARDAYLYVLNNCENAPERLATVQKAAATLPYATMQDLLALERSSPEGVAEFESVRDDLARRFVAEGDTDKALTVDPKYVQRVERLAAAGGTASDALLLGWYHLRRDNMSAAEQWFRRAHDKEDPASASQGLALTLVARKVPAEAEAVLYPWRDSSPDALATYFAATANLLAIDPPMTLDAAVLARIAAETTKAREPATAQQFGWYARALNQPATAAQWFATALRWKPDDEPSAYGLALSRDQLGDKDGVVEIQRLWSGRSERIARLGEVKEQLADVNRARVPTAETQRSSPEASTRTTVVMETVEQPVAQRPRVAGTTQKSCAAELAAERRSTQPDWRRRRRSTAAGA